MSVKKNFAFLVSGLSIACSSGTSGDAGHWARDTGGGMDAMVEETGDIQAEGAFEAGQDQGTVVDKPGVDPAVFTFCNGMDPVASAEPTSIVYHNGHLDYTMSGQEPGDRDAVQFIPLHPFRLRRVTLHLAGQGGAARVRVTGDFGGSRPDLDNDLVEPLDVMVPSTKVPFELDLSGAGIEVRPPARFWVVFEHVDEGLSVKLDTGEDPGDDSHSLYWNQEQIAQWEAQGQAFKWGGFKGNDLGIEVSGSYFCRVEDRLFRDRAPGVPALGGRNAGRLVVGDVDGDGFDDVLGVLGGQPKDPETGKLQAGGQFLLRNMGGFSFQDATEGSGLVGTGITQAQMADVDGDGDVDVFGGVYVNPSDPGADNGKRSTVFLNDGAGSFTAVHPSGLEYEAPVAAAAFLDFDADGILDIYLGAWLKEYPLPDAAVDRLFKGNGDGTFRDVTAGAGLPVDDFKALPCYGVVTGDYDDDGDTDVFVANYGYAPNALWRNQGDGTFVNAAKQAGVNYQVTGPQDGSGGNGFGGDFGDFDNDGDLDLFVANIAHPRYQPWSDRSILYLNGGTQDPVFQDVTADFGIAYDEGDIDGTFVDFDNDGRLDLFTCPVYPHHYAHLYRQAEDGTFVDVTYFAGIVVHECQSNTWSDLDHDGDLDLLAASRRSGGIPYLYENRVGQDNHWIAFVLVGTQSNRSGLGARVTVEAGGAVQVREVRAGKGHNGMCSTLTAHFGLGREGRVESAVVRWPSGLVQELGALDADHAYRVTEAQAGGTEIAW